MIYGINGMLHYKFRLQFSYSCRDIVLSESPQDHHLPPAGYPQIPSIL